eukprot:TRINITY_DN13719_c0_g1_i1.p1 TRINITY_DN13719_c0_g1~~TRINITY_DN13719_c0_g1_i1.p1  ORF type:complete len:201 (+),score=15.50 TRINITY_DN13719_c0_g1_i1:44-604(+)
MTLELSVPAKVVKYGSAIVLAAFWLAYIPLKQQLIGLMMGCVFANIETMWTGSRLAIWKQPDAPKRNLINIWIHGHTTREQFFSLVFWTPICHFLYFHFVTNAYLRVLLFPINVWMCEICTGYYLAFVWQRRAWLYDDAWAYLHGNITLAYAPHWMGLGFQHEVFTWVIYEPCAIAVEEVLLTLFG